MNSRWMQLLVGLTVGSEVLFVGAVLSTSWEVEQLRATTLDRDFTGLVCGVPLDDPGSLAVIEEGTDKLVSP